MPPVPAASAAAAAPVAGDAAAGDGTDKGDYQAAFNQLKNSQYDRAIADFTAAIRINPQYAVAYNNRGRTYQAMGDMTRALDDYEQARRIEPDNSAYQGFGMRQR